MAEKTGTTIAESGDQKLIDRVRSHLGKDALELTKDQVVHYLDGGQYGGVPDPRSVAGLRQQGEFTAQGGSGPKKKP